MNEFSPGVGVELKTVLDIAHAHSGDRDRQKDAVVRAVAKIGGTTNPKQRLNRANNVLIGMSQCGLYNLDDGTLTELGSELRDAATDDERHEMFARHLITDCHGDDLIDAVELIRHRGEAVNGGSIRNELRAQGFTVTENSSDAGKIRQWLGHAGIVDGSWNVDDDRLDEVIGVTTTGLAAWRALPRPQRAFVEQVRRLEGDSEGWLTVRQVKKLCELQHGRDVFQEGQLRREVIDPLEDGGWLETRGRGTGRGGDSGDVRATAQLEAVQLPLDVDAKVGIPSDLRTHLATPLVDIFRDLRSSNTHEKGLALELLSLRLIRDLGLYPVAFRLRSAATNGAEVDLIADGLHLHYSRWLFQCKNTRTVHVHDIAKEVGMATVLKAHVIVMVTTGKFSGTVKSYASGLAESSGLQALLIDGKVMSAYRTAGPRAVIDYLRDEARHVLRLKASQAVITREIT